MRSIFVTIVAVQLACLGVHAEHATQVPAGAAQTAPSAKTPPVVNPVGAATKTFQDRVKEYVALRNKVEDTVPQLTETSNPATIAARERALGEALIKSRPHAKMGDYFVKEYVPVLRAIIKNDFAKRTAAERKALIVELPKGLKVGVNTIYPTTIPLATSPANLLKSLPELPPELEYRILYRHLILRDVEGNYIVDMVPEIFPIPM